MKSKGFKDFKDFFPVKLEILSPVHIGSGHEVDPFSYIIREDEKGDPMLYFIDLPAWIESRPDTGATTDYFATHTFSDVRKWLYEHIEDPARHALAAIPVKDPNIVKSYREVVYNKRPENRMLLDSALKNPLTHGLIIPGSSIKGAIRTAILDYLDIKYDLDLRNFRDKFSKLDQMVFGSPKESVFKALKISDFDAPPSDAYIVSSREMSRNAQKTPTPKNNCEVTRSLLMDAAPYLLWGQAALGTWQQEGLDVHAPVNGKDIKETLSFSRVRQIVNEFYMSRFTREWKTFYALPHFGDAGEHSRPLKKAVEETDEGAMLLRVGHYSHIECVTVTKNKPQTRRKKDGSGYYPWGTTRTLANGLFPFGWVRLSRVTDEEYRQGRQKLVEERDKALQRRAKALQRSEEIKRKMEEEKRAKEEALRKAEEDEQGKREAFEKLPEYKKKIIEIENPKTDSNTVMKRFFELDEYKGNEHRAIAEAIKKRWIADNRWKVKKGKKQYKKVQAIKKILGED